MTSPVLDGAWSQSGGGGTTAGNANDGAAAGRSKLSEIFGNGSNVEAVKGGRVSGGELGGGKGGFGGELGGVNLHEVVAGSPAMRLTS